MEQQKTETRSITAEQRKRVEEVCFRSLALIGRNCEYLEQHFDRTGADESTRQAVADIDTAAIQLDRTLTEAITLLEFLHEDTKPQLYPIDLCELLQQVSAQSDMIRAQLGVDIRLDYGGCTTCCVMADRRDAFQLVFRVNRAVFGRMRDIDHAREYHMVVARVRVERLHIVAQVVRVELAVLMRNGQIGRAHV